MNQTIPNPNPNEAGDSFAALFEASSEAKPGAVETSGEGNIVKGLVVQVTRDAVVVDIGGKSEGVISKEEFADAVGAVNVYPNAVFRASAAHGAVAAVTGA